MARTRSDVIRDPELERIAEFDTYMQKSEYPLRDVVHNWIVAKHRDKGKPWTTKGIFSDKVFWYMAIYELWGWVPTLIFLYLIYFLANYTNEHYGVFKAVSFLVVVALIRVNLVVRAVQHTNRLLKK